MAKRQAAQALANKSTKRRKTMPDQPGTGTSFLDLPPELRTNILVYAAQAGGVGLLHHHNEAQLSSLDPLCLVNKQIRQEYLAVLYGSAATIRFHVLDFDFGHIVAWLDKLQLSEQRALPTAMTQQLTTYTTPRTFLILLDFTPSCPAIPPSLLHWLERFGAEEEQAGHDADFEYQIFSKTAVRNWVNRTGWARAVSSSSSPRGRGKGGRQVVVKIWKALQRCDPFL